MDTTVFLAQIWGPIMLAVGIGAFFSRSYYKKIYQDLDKESFGMLVFGMAAMAVGIVQVSVHNEWETLPQFLISFFGWATLLKGTVFTAAPHLVESTSLWALKARLIPASAVLMLLVGAYLSWFAYLA